MDTSINPAHYVYSFVIIIMFYTYNLEDDASNDPNLGCIHVTKLGLLQYERE